eukprot:4681402-Amphidinium_carterae.2
MYTSGKKWHLPGALGNRGTASTSSCDDTLFLLYSFPRQSCSPTASWIGAEWAHRKTTWLKGKTTAACQALP